MFSKSTEDCAADEILVKAAYDNSTSGAVNVINALVICNHGPLPRGIAVFSRTDLFLSIFPIRYI